MEFVSNIVLPGAESPAAKAWAAKISGGVCKSKVKLEIR